MSFKTHIWFDENRKPSVGVDHSLYMTALKEIEDLRAENERLQQTVAEQKEFVGSRAEEVVQLRAANAELVEALKYYSEFKLEQKNGFLNVPSNLVAQTVLTKHGDGK
jgi:hypothetical protein